MSNYIEPTIHPVTGKVEDAEWIDDYFGRHRYGVRFPDGSVFPEEKIWSKEPPLEPQKET